MTFKEMYQVERTKWDALAERSLASLKILPVGENFSTHAQRASTMVGVDDFLGDLRGKHVLEDGCELGERLL